MAAILKGKMTMRTMMLVIGCVFGAVTFAQEFRNDKNAIVRDQITAARQLSATARDKSLAKIALEQTTRSNPVEALHALSQMSSPKSMRDGLLAIQLDRHSDSPSRSGRFMPSKVDLTAKSTSPGGARGGNPLANFGPLIDLIQSTVSPDVWPDAGGDSSIIEYPQGIRVNPDGLVGEVTVAKPADMLANIDVMLGTGDHDWRLASDHRCVSLRRLSLAVLKARLGGLPIDEVMRNVGGLSDVKYVVLVPDKQDVILVGAVGGVERSQGWLRDRQTGRATLRLDYFATAAASIFSGQTFGCTIEVSPQALASAASVSDQVRSGDVPIGLAAEALSNAIGKQQVIVFGTAGDSPLGHLLVHADRHMKQLAFGIHPLPTGRRNYLDQVTRHIREGVPDGNLLRLWFTGSPIAVRSDDQHHVFELAGRPLKLSSETKLAAADGSRLASDEDVRITEFVDEFNLHFDEIAELHPVYSALESVYEAAALAELLRRSDAAEWMPSIVAPLLLDDPAQGQFPVPRSVDSIAMLHRVNQGKQRHAVVVASGGVVVSTASTVEKTFRSYPPLRSLTTKYQVPANHPDEIWWWNAK